MDTFRFQESISNWEACNAVLAELNLLNRSAKKPLGSWVLILVLVGTMDNGLVISYNIQAAVGNIMVLRVLITNGSSSTQEEIKDMSIPY